MSKKYVAAKYDVPRNAVSTLETKRSYWPRSRKKGTNSKRKQLCEGNFENADRAIYTWFIANRSQQIPIDGVILKEKAREFAKALGETEFNASNCWLSNWKKGRSHFL